ncbi:PLC-like phosphodiesterase [Globomyces pollinis-pini]|nr:PLC-like phosphodiesterase [Globomyces pollinis-pini]
MTELLDDPNENWMSNHSNNKLADLIIPGTHNSAAYKISNHLICSKLWWIGKLGKRFVLTQTLTITEQLKLGIRAFDLRISLLNNKPYVSHTCRLSSLKSILLQILAYLNDHPTEVILIRVKGDWDNRPKCWKSTVSLIRNILGNYLCIPKQDSVGLQSIISDLCRENTRVMIYSNELCEYQLPCYNENDHFKEYWYNTMSLDKLSNLMEIDIVNPNQYPSQSIYIESHLKILEINYIGG